jgi:peptidoglycan/LPS O-acetylase OafA/YrhL
MVFISTIVAHFMLLPNEYKDFGQSIVSTTFFVSNILFWMEAGYFDAESLMKPLLHTWSLAVEEQYYIFYPPLLIVIYKFLNRNGVPLIVGLWVASLAWSVWSSSHDPTAAFYLAPSRIWELLTGAILALGYVRETESKIGNDAIGGLGLLMILYAVVSFDHTTEFPGYVALIPCVGTAMIIYSGNNHNTYVSRILSTRFLVFTGLISYSLYLWHWPVLVFSHLYRDEPFHPWLIVLLLMLSYILAWLSWNFIERSFRGRQSVYTRKQMFSGAAIVMAGVSAFGLLLHFSRGLHGRVPDSVNEIVEQIESLHSYMPENCLRKGVADLSSGVSPCALNDKNNEALSVVLWGDSHAAALVPGLLNLGKQKPGINAGFIGMQGCPPLKGVMLASSKDRMYDNCTRFNDLVLRELSASEQVKVVILAGYWSLYANGIRKDSDPNTGDIYLCQAGDCDILDTKNNPELMKKGINNMLNVLLPQDKNVILIGPIPDLDINGASTIARMQLLEIRREVRLSREAVESHMGFAISVMNAIEREKGVKSLFPHTVLCDNDYCNVMHDKMPLYVDRHHLSPVGASFVMQRLGINEVISAALGHVSKDHDYNKNP